MPRQRDLPRGQRTLGLQGPRGSGAGRVNEAGGGGRVGGALPRAYSVQATGSWGLRQLAGAFNQLAGVSEQIMDTEFKLRAKAVERQQSLAGFEYGAGVELDQLTLPAGDSIGDEAFRRSAMLAARAKVDVATFDDVEALAKQHPGKPEEFRNALEERARAFVGKLPPDMRPDAAMSYARLGQQRYLQLDDQRRDFERDQNRASIIEATELHQTAAARAARQGDWNAAQEEIAKLAELTAAAGPVELGGSGALSLVEIEKQSQAAEAEITGQFVNGWAERASNPAAALAGLRQGTTGSQVVDEAISRLRPEVIDQIGNRLEAEVRSREAEARQRAAEARAAQREAMQELRFQAGMVVDNEEAAAEFGETASTGWEEVVRAAYGDKAQPIIDRITSRRETATLAKDLTSMPTEDIAGLLEGRAPAGEGYAFEARDFKALQGAAEQVINRRLKDPAGEALRAFPALREAMADPAQMGAALRESERIQTEVFGVPKARVQLLTGEQAGGVVESFKGAATADERLALLNSYTTMGDDEMARRVLAQLEEKGLPADGRFALERAREGDIAGARDILGGIAIDPKDLPKLGEASAADVGKAVDQRMGDTGPAGLTTRLANMSRQPGLFARAAAERATMQRLATQYAAAGDDPETAAAKAEKSVYGDTKVAGDDDLGYVRVPPSVDPDAMTDAMERVRSSLDLSIYAPVAPPVRPGQSVTGATEGQRYLADRDYQAWAQSIRDGGIWADVEGGYTLLSPTGRALMDPSDPTKPRVFTADEIIGMAAAPASSLGPRAQPGYDPGLTGPGLGGDALAGGSGLDRLAPGIGGTMEVPLNPSLSELARRLLGRVPTKSDDPQITAEEAAALGIPIGESKRKQTAQDE